MGHGYLKLSAISTGVGEDGGEKIDDGWIFIGEEDVNLDGKVMDNMEGVLMGPTYVLVPSKG